MQDYTSNEIEEKWQRYWAKEQLYNVDTSVADSNKYYNLVMFPYPSGDRLHIGHQFTGAFFL
jgi:leucyl-tRNA synthetase